MGAMLRAEMSRLRSQYVRDDGKPISQKEFAQRAGLSESLVAHVEAGTRSMSTDSINKLADSLRLSKAKRKALFDAKAADKAAEAGPDGVSLAAIQAELAEVKDLLRAALSGEPVDPSVLERLSPSKPPGTTPEADDA